MPLAGTARDSAVATIAYITARPLHSLASRGTVGGRALHLVDDAAHVRVEDRRGQGGIIPQGTRHMFRIEATIGRDRHEESEKDS